MKAVMHGYARSCGTKEDKRSMTLPDIAESPVGRLRRHTTVLVISSYGAIRRLVCRHLTHEGFRCFEADSAIEALEVLWIVAAGKIDLIIVDADVPDIGAAALVRASRERWIEQSVLFLLGNPTQLTEGEVSSVRGVVLPKPFTRAQLLGGVGRALERRRVPR
jgi:DNA-binding response OmpR family regulator